MRPRVLFADDSAVSRAAMARGMERAGLEPLVVASAAEALGVDPGALAAALLDLDLGDGAGDDVAAGLRARAPSLPIAFWTSATAGASLDRAAALGPVFRKPGHLAQAVEWAASHARGRVRPAQ